MRETKFHVLDQAGQRVWRGRCATEPAAIAAAVRRYAPAAVRIGLETGPLTTWLWTALTAANPFLGADLLTNCRQMDFEPSIDQLPAPAADLPYREWNIQHALLQRRLGHHRLRTHNVRPCRDQAHGCRCPMA